MDSTHLREGEVIEVLFDADSHLTPGDWDAPPCAPCRQIPPPIACPRRCSTSSTASLCSPLLLSPTQPPSPTRCAWDAARRTAPRPTSAFVPSARGLDETALFLSGAPGAEEQVRRLARGLDCAREVKPVSGGQRKARVPAKWGSVEVTETMSIERLRDEIKRAERETREGPRFFRGMRKRFSLQM